MDINFFAHNMDVSTLLRFIPDLTVLVPSFRARTTMVYDPQTSDFVDNVMELTLLLGCGFVAVRLASRVYRLLFGNPAPSLEVVVEDEHPQQELNWHIGDRNEITIKDKLIKAELEVLLQLAKVERLYAVDVQKTENAVVQTTVGTPRLSKPVRRPTKKRSTKLKLWVVKKSLQTKGATTKVRKIPIPQKTWSEQVIRMPTWEELPEYKPKVPEVKSVALPQKKIISMPTWEELV